MKTYLNIEVFDQPLDVSAAAGETRTASLSVVSSKVGVRRVYDKSGMPVRTRTVTVVAVGAAAIQELRAFINRRKGRVVPFWMATGIADLVVLNDAAGGQASFNIDSTNYPALFASGQRSHVAVNGQYAQVQSAVAAQTSTLVTLTSNLTSALKAGTNVQHLMLYRLANDEVELTFEGVDVASAPLELVELLRET